MEYYFDYNTDIGIMRISESAGFITGISWDSGFTESIRRETPLIEDAGRQLQEYFERKRKVFDLPLDPKGTAFQLKVWKALTDIPYGETRSYKDIAVAIGNSMAVRAVGGANNKNPFSIVVPCHRVIGSDGKLVGYGGGLEIKRFLLRLEASNKL